MKTKGLMALLTGSMLVLGTIVPAFADDTTVPATGDQVREQKRDGTGDQQRLREHAGDQSGDRLREQKMDGTGDQQRLREHAGDQSGDQLRQQKRDQMGSQDRIGAGSRTMQRDRSMSTGGGMGSGRGSGRGGSR